MKSTIRHQYHDWISWIYLRPCSKCETVCPFQGYQIDRFTTENPLIFTILVVHGESEDDIYDAILSDEPPYPPHMPAESVSILQRLLDKEPKTRLGCGPTGAQDIMNHPYFRNVEWEDIYHKRVKPPFLPRTDSSIDVSNFDQDLTSVTPRLSPVESGKPLLHMYPAGVTLKSFTSALNGYARGIPRFLAYGRSLRPSKVANGYFRSGKNPGQMM